MKDTAAMLRRIGFTEGDPADKFEELVDDTVPELLCLDPKTPPRTAPRMSINPTVPQNIIRLRAESLCTGISQAWISCLSKFSFGTTSR